MGMRRQRRCGDAGRRIRRPGSQTGEQGCGEYSAAKDTFHRRPRLWKPGVDGRSPSGDAGGIRELILPEHDDDR